MQDLGHEPRATASDGTGLSIKLRTCCEQCHSCKLKCSREKPTCARCLRHGKRCVYAPSKRPGRPRKAPSLPLPSSGLLAKETSHGRKHTSPENVWSVDVTTHPASPQDHHLRDPDGPLGQIGNSYMPAGSCAQPWALPSDMELESLGMFHDTDMLSTAGIHTMDLSLPIPLDVCTDHSTAKTPAQDSGDSLADMLTSAADAKGAHHRRFERDLAIDSFLRASDIKAPSLWPVAMAQFREGCTLLTRNIEAAHPHAPSPLSQARGTACLCRAALIKLMLHRKRSSIADGTLDTALQLHRLLRWTWELQKGCVECRDDALTYTTLLFVASEVVSMWQAMIFSQIKHCNRSTSREGRQGQSPGTPDIQVRLGNQVIDGATKVAFLCGLMSTKLRHIRTLTDEISGKDQQHGDGHGETFGLGTKPASAVLRVLTASVVEHVHVSLGMLSTVEPGLSAPS